jgi:hypothetical protein
MIRKIAAVVLGIAAAVAIVAATEAIGHAVYPVPADLDVQDAVQFGNYLESLPFGAFFFVLSAWTLATLGGCLLACFISREKPFVYAAIVGGFMLAATVTNLIMIPHPLWFSIITVISISIMTYLAGSIASSQLSSGKDGRELS